MSLSIPISQKYSSDIQVFDPKQQWIRITPNQTRDVITLSETNSSNTVTFELSPDNCVNLSQSYLEWEQRFYWDKKEQVSENLKVFLFNTFNLSTIRVYNITGSLICDLDFQYNDYRDIAAQIAKKVILDDTYFDPKSKLFTGIHKEWDDTLKRWKIAKRMIDVPTSDAPTKDIPMQDQKNIYKVRMVLGELYNTILSLSNDMFFGEKIFIQFTFGQRSKSCFATKQNGTEFFSIQPHVDLYNLELYACYNTDADCNSNTINWVYRHPIDFNDFNIVQTTVTNSTSTSHFQYNFTIDSSIGPYVKYILYTAVDDNGLSVSFGDKDCRFRWLLNDFVYTPDFLMVANQDSYYQMQKILATTYFDQYNTTPFPDKFIEILKFTADNNLTNIKSRGGRPLDSQLKITFDCYNPKFGPNQKSQNGSIINSVTHRFYIITGRILEIGMRGIQRVV